MKNTKKKKGFFARLFTRPKKLVVNITPENKYLVINVNPDGEDLVEALGMSLDKADEIGKAVMIAFVNHNNTVAVAAEVSPLCTHSNELFFMTTIISKHQMHLQRENMMHGIINGK